ncbi:MAG: hypothetical protein JW863_00510 [Chitinispirillaceae bacterium]|nr:hypothetical protein [Chitinispirillaceae bacterium]
MRRKKCRGTVWLEFCSDSSGMVDSVQITYVGSVMGFISGFSDNNSLGEAASYVTLAGEVAWTTSTIMSLCYSSKLLKIARYRLAVSPLYSQGHGVNCTMAWSF